MSSNIDFFFEPESVAIVGASHKPGKIGFELVRSILECGFSGEIFPVNPKGGEILGLKVYKSISDTSSKIDVAVIVTPSKTVPNIVKECGLHGIKGCIIISAGFSEIGNRKLEKLLLENAKRYDVRIIGPNSAGIINTSANFHACLEFRVPKGPVSLISQSGAVGGVMFAMARAGVIGFNKFVSCGNSCDVNEMDVLKYLLRDEETKSIAIYVETLHSGRSFLESIRKFKGLKPIIALKGGKFSAGLRAAASHTGSLASPYAVYSAVFKQCGIFEVPSIGSLFSSAKISAYHSSSNGERVVVVTNSGGPGVVATDMCESLGLSVPEPSERLKEKLSTFLPSICSLRNPIDLTAMAGYDWYFNTLKELSSSMEYDYILSICVPPSFMDPMDAAKAIVDLYDVYSEIPVIPCFLYGSMVMKSIKYLEKHNIPCAYSIMDAVYSLKALSYFGRLRGERS